MSAHKMLADIRRKLLSVTYLLELEEKDTRHCEKVLRNIMGLLEIKQEEGVEDELSTDEEPMVPDEFHQRLKVVGLYTAEAEWVVPDYINLKDEKKWEYWARWETLYIKNLCTGDVIQVERKGDIEIDSKHCDNLEVQYNEDCDDDCDCTHCQRTKVCDECGKQGGCYDDCVYLASD
jgi:hypothetical protein